ILDDNAVDFGALAGGWSLTIVTSVTQVCNGTAVLVPRSGTVGPASPYPTTIAVSGVLGTITRATLTWQGLVHSFPDDMDFLLTGPGGGSAIVMSDAGGPTSTGGGITVTLDDAAALPLPHEQPPHRGPVRQHGPVDLQRGEPERELESLRRRRCDRRRGRPAERVVPYAHDHDLRKRCALRRPQPLPGRPRAR